MSEVYIVAVNPGDTLDDFIEYLAEDPVGALDSATFSERDATIAELRAEIAALRAQLNAVPVNCIRRYYAFTNYDAAAANDAGYTTQQFDSDDMRIGMWLESLEDDA